MIFVSRINGTRDRYFRGQEYRVESVEESDDQREKEEERDRKRRFEQIKMGQKDVRASQIMSSKLIAISSDTSLEEAWNLMSKHRFNHLPVVSNEGKLVGMLTEGHLLKSLKNEKKSAKKYKVKELMRTDILCASPDTDIKQIAEVFFEEHVGSMPIVNERSELVGILTPSDILRTVFKVANLERKED